MFPERYDENLAISRVNTLAMRNYYVPFPDEQSALSASGREHSDLFYLLNGEWNFRYYPSILDVVDRPLMAVLKELDQTVSVPSTWQTNAIEGHHYLNERFAIPFDPPFVPADNPVGVYRTSFLVEEGSLSYDWHLNLEGVDSCFYLWCNEQFVGYSQISHSLAEFDLTPFLQAGENSITLAVLKWCDGTYLEVQDKFRTSGIFRDVYLLKRRKERVNRYRLEQEVDLPAQSAILKLEVVEQVGNPTLSYALYDATGKLVASGNGTGEIKIEEVELWSAESPYLYTLLLQAGGEYIRERIGFRRFEVLDQTIYLNGKPIKFYGVNHHDSRPKTGPVVSLAEQEEDIILMKQHHFNAIRTAHYPKSPVFYELCDQYGMYVLSEADIEMHGIVSIYGKGGYDNYNQLAQDPRFEAPVLERVRASILPYQHFSCVFMWSLGNESGFGPVFDKAVTLANELDSSRFLHYEGLFHAEEGERSHPLLTVQSRMYASPLDVEENYLKSGNKPFILCEYSHAMGNSCGDLQTYADLMHRYATFAGAFVWEWCDHAVDVGEGTEPLYRYGGDFGEDYHDGHFCMDGLVTPDRQAHSSLKEYQQIHRPLSSHLVKKEQLLIKNRYYFIHLLHTIRVCVEYVCNARVVADYQEVISVIAPREEYAVFLPFQWRQERGDQRLRISYLVEQPYSVFEKGAIIATEEVILQADPVCLEKSSNSREEQALVWAHQETAREISLQAGTDNRIVFDKQSGLLRQCKMRGMERLGSKAEWTIWRAPIDNDRFMQEKWREAGLDAISYRVYESQIEREEDAIVVSFSLALLPAYRQPVVKIEAVWHVSARGEISVSLRWKKDTVYPDLPRLGIVFPLPQEQEQVEYIGYGPYESYSDKHHASYLGEFSCQLDELFVPYLFPQENGSHWNSYYVSLADGKRKTVITSTSPFSFNCSRYSIEELTNKQHLDELEKATVTYLVVDLAHAGIGSASCGPSLAEEYRVSDVEYQLDFSLLFHDLPLN